MGVDGSIRRLNEFERPTRTHFLILAMSWAGWLFDFYDLKLFSFLVIRIKKSLALSDSSLGCSSARRSPPPRSAGSSSAGSPTGSGERPRLGSSIGKAGIWMLLTQTGGTLGYLSFGIVTDWKGRRVAYTIYSFIKAVGLFAVTWFWGALAVDPAMTIVFMFLVGLGAGNYSGYGPIFSEIFPTRVRSTAMGTAFNLARGVQFFTPLIITTVATRYGLGDRISLAGFFALITGIWVWTLPETRGTKIGIEPAQESPAKGAVA